METRTEFDRPGHCDQHFSDGHEGSLEVVRVMILFALSRIQACVRSGRPGTMASPWFGSGTTLVTPLSLFPGFFFSSTPFLTFYRIACTISELPFFI